MRDQCLLARKHFGDKTDLVFLEHTVEFCLTNKTYSMADLSDTYRYYKSWTDEGVEEEEGEEPESLPSAKPSIKRPIKVAQRDLHEYTTALLESSSGGRS